MSEKGEATRERLYRAALQLFAEQGFESTTMRAIAREADVSAGLLYRYFPSKRAVVLELYDELSLEYARRVADAPPGPWHERFVRALTTSLEVLGPHRDVLSALTPALVSRGQEGIFSPGTSSSRERVKAAFSTAVSGADDAPDAETGAALAELLYMAHLAAILWWLLDGSEDQAATRGLVEQLRSLQIVAGPAMALPFVRTWVRSMAVLVASAFGMPDDGSAPLRR